MKRIVTFLLLLTTTSVFAQTVVSGIVTDEAAQALPGVNITLEGSYDGTTSDRDGSFSFSTIETGERVLIVTFVGYKTLRHTILLDGRPVQIKLVMREEINQLQAVTISAGSFTAGDEKRRTILKAVDIATTAGATADIAGALNTLPGTSKVGESGRLFVRGGESNETRTFIDGIAVLDAYSPSAPNTPSRGRFMPFMFKGTSFSTGGYSSEYGQALSSTLVLTSKDKADLNQTDIGLLSVGGDVAHTQVGERGSWTGKIQYTDIRPYFQLINQRIDWKEPISSWQGSTAYRHQVGKDGMIKFYGISSHTQFSLYNHDIDEPSFKQFFQLKNDYRYGNLTYKQSLNTNWSVRGGLSYNYNTTQIKTENIPAGQREEGVHSKVVFENSVSDRLEVKLGGEVISRVYRASRNDSSTQFTETISAGFAEADAFANKNFVARAGLRVEHDNLNGQTGVDPRISIAYKPGERGQFSFAAGRFRQSANNALLRRDHRVGSEMAEHLILNYQIVEDNRTFRVEAYYKKYSRLVKFQYAGNDTLLNNTGDGFAKGVELFWRDNRSVRNLDYWVSYSLLDTRRNYLNFPYSAVPSFASRHNFSVVGKYFWTSIKSQIGVTYSWASSRTYYNPNVSVFNSSRTPSYQDLSMNVSYLPKNWLIIYLSCTNLLGRNNVFGYQYSNTANDAGVYNSRPITQAAKHFLFAGVFITISKNKSVNQLPNL